MNFILLLLRPLFPKTKFVVREAIVPSYITGRHPGLAPLLSIAYRYLYAMATVVISPSRQIQDELSGLGLGNVKHALLYNPVDEELIRTKSLEGGGHLSDATIKFVASGRLNRQKGFDRLIESLKEFSPPFPWSLSILGEGEERENLAGLIARSGLEKNISLLGHVSSPWSHYRNADFFLLPSRWEGMPNVVLESLTCGTPVIAMREAGGVEEIANMAANGAIYPCKTIGDFVGVMLESENNLLRDKKSLLPSSFQKQLVTESFNFLLSRI